MNGTEVAVLDNAEPKDAEAQLSSYVNLERFAEIAAELKTYELGRAKAKAEQIERILKMGRLLIEAKRLLGHNHFMEWVKVTYPFGEASHQTALNHMWLAEAYDAGFVKFKTVLNLGLREAYEVAREELDRDRSQDRGVAASRSTTDEKSKAPKWQSRWPYTGPKTGQILHVKWRPTDKSREVAWVWPKKAGNAFGYLLLYEPDTEKDYRGTDHQEIQPATWEQMAYGVLRAFGGGREFEQYVYDYHPAIRTLLGKWITETVRNSNRDFEHLRAMRKLTSELENKHAAELQKLDRLIPHHNRWKIAETEPTTAD